jgi:hypothetical protein
MNKKYFLVSALLFVIWMLGGLLVHGVMLGKDYLAMGSVYRPEAEAMGYFPFMLLAHVMLAMAFTWIYLRGREDKPWLQQGLRFGALLTFLTTTPTYLIYYAVQVTPTPMVVKQIIGDGLWMLLLGAVVAFCYRSEAEKR